MMMEKLEIALKPTPWIFPVVVFVRFTIVLRFSIASTNETLEMSPPLEMDPNDETNKSVQASP